LLTVGVEDLANLGGDGMARELFNPGLHLIVPENFIDRR
jgi:hypothetical protein